MIIGPIDTGSEYRKLRSILDEHLPNLVNLQHLRYDRQTHREQTAWCQERAIGGNAVYAAPLRLDYRPSREVMVDTTENWSYFSMLVNFRDPDLAFEFKIRFG